MRPAHIANVFQDSRVFLAILMLMNARAAHVSTVCAWTMLILSSATVQKVMLDDAVIFCRRTRAGKVRVDMDTVR